MGNRRPADPPRPPTIRRIFLLSPALVGGVRAGYLFRPSASFALARRLHTEGAPLGEIFTFASGLYFRGKLTYARQFADPSTDVIRIITANTGLVEPERVLNAAELRRYGNTDIHESDTRFTRPLRRDATQLAKVLSPAGQVILLGSIASAKYRTTLLTVFGARLVFPVAFIGRGDMSRGALLLRAARAGVELPYASVEGAALTGKRPVRLPVKGSE